jgi:formamidopyrimidine-DNA glycosylase
MPELPEVETVCRLLRRVLVDHKIKAVEAVPDTIVFGDAPPEAIESALVGRTVKAIGRRGKTWWIETDKAPVLVGHLGMAGWVREVGAPTIRLKEHGKAPLDDENGRPRFLKLLITSDEGRKVAFTDGRRLGRVRLTEDAKTDKKLKELGPDALTELPKDDKFDALFKKRSAPIKALLMDQTILSGIGNWVADEALYHARIAPNRAASSLTPAEFKALRKQVLYVLETAVEAGADEHKYPKGWMFHHRWGGGKGVSQIDGKKIVREEVGGRTTAWVPTLQK